MIIDDKSIKEFYSTFPEITQKDVPLNQISRWRVGGNADIVVCPKSTLQLSKIRSWLHQRGLPNIVIGSTSNLLFDDLGYKGIIIKIGSEFASYEIKEQLIIADPGVWVPLLARKAMQVGLTGIEHTCGIPGTLGGLICMNGGSQRKGIGQHVVEVETVDKMGKITKYSQNECKFAYRESIFQSSDEIISKVVLALEKNTNINDSRREMLAILRDRRLKFPLKKPNCGSVFVSNPAMYEKYGPPGKIIESLGLKGFKIGGAVVSEKHANFIVNSGQAKSEDILKLINFIRDQVRLKTGYQMVVEAKYVQHNGIISSI